MPMQKEPSQALRGLFVRGVVPEWRHWRQSGIPLALDRGCLFDRGQGLQNQVPRLRRNAHQG